MNDIDISGIAAGAAQMSAMQAQGAVSTSVMKLAMDSSETIAMDLVSQLSDLDVGSKAPSKLDVMA